MRQFSNKTVEQAMKCKQTHCFGFISVKITIRVINVLVLSNKRLKGRITVERIFRKICEFVYVVDEEHLWQISTLTIGKVGVIVMIQLVIKRPVG